MGLLGTSTLLVMDLVVLDALVGALHARFGPRRSCGCSSCKVGPRRSFGCWGLFNHVVAENQIEVQLAVEQ